MTQQKTIIQSGNQILRAYELEGILTPASGVEEYIKHIININDNSTSNISLDLSSILMFDILLFNLGIKLNSLPVSDDFIIDFLVNNFLVQRQDVTVNNDSHAFVCISIPICQKDNLEIRFGSSPLDISDIQLQGKRIAISSSC
mgnify:CR=1 FL=1